MEDPAPLGKPREWEVTVGADFPGTGHGSLAARIVRPPLTEVPSGLRDAALRAGAVPGRRGDRAAFAGDLRALEALAGDGGAPPGFREALAASLAGWGRRRFRLSLPRNRTLELGDPPALFGILNATPDSFSDGGAHLDPGRALEAALEMIAAGADAIDVGGESTRPGADPVPADEERRRVEPVLRRIRHAADIPISIDTTKAEVARMAFAEGADILNDVSALRGDPGMVALVRDSRVPLVLLHRRGLPRDMQASPRYDDAVREVYEFLADRIRSLEAEGLEPASIIVDPGIGFGKRIVDNVALIRGIDELRSLGRPVMVGASRKSFIGALLDGSPVEAREEGTLAVHAAAALMGAAALRVHRVAPHRQLLRIFRALATAPVGEG